MDMFAYPLIKPANDETIDMFVTRFINDETMSRIFSDPAQRLAVAYVEWGKGFITYKNAKPNKDILRTKITITRLTPDEEDRERYGEDINPEVEGQEGDSVSLLTQTNLDRPEAIVVENPNNNQIPSSENEKEVIFSGRKMIGYASVSNIQDLEHDIIMPGAWQKTLNERVKAGKVPLMTKHLADGGLAMDTIGHMNSASKEDNVGLFAVFDMLSTKLAEECYNIAKSSIDVMKPIGLSVEFFPVDGKYEPNQFGGYTFHEVKLLQVTFTPTPCNELSAVYAVKQAPPRPDVRRKWLACLSKYSLRTR